MVGDFELRSHFLVAIVLLLRAILGCPVLWTKALSLQLFCLNLNHVGLRVENNLILPVGVGISLDFVLNTVSESVRLHASAQENGSTHVCTSVGLRIYLLLRSLKFSNGYTLSSRKSVSAPAECGSLTLGSRTYVWIGGVLLLALAGIEIVEQQTHFLIHFFQKMLFHTIVVLNLCHDSVFRILCPLPRFLCTPEVLRVVRLYRSFSICAPTLHLP